MSVEYAACPDIDGGQLDGLLMKIGSMVGNPEKLETEVKNVVFEHDTPNAIGKHTGDVPIFAPALGPGTVTLPFTTVELMDERSFNTVLTMADSKDKVEEVDTSSNRASPPTSPDPPASPSKTAPSTTVASPPVPVSPLKPEPPPPGSQPVPDHPVPPSSTTTNSPAPRRPRPPTKGILKPPPPPAKPTLGNRLRDIVTVVGGGAKSLFELPPGSDTPGAGPSTPQPPSQQSVGGTLNALGGRIGLGFSRLVAGSPGNSTTSTPNDSPVPSRSIGLPENGVTPLVSEKKRQKQPLKRATFLLPSLSITYPISSQGEPWSQKVLEERQKVSKARNPHLFLA